MAAVSTDGSTVFVWIDVMHSGAGAASHRRERRLNVGLISVGPPQLHERRHTGGKEHTTPAGTLGEFL
jgi:hypothetical protein